jgi:hypothetical protein
MLSVPSKLSYDWSNVKVIVTVEFAGIGAGVFHGMVETLRELPDQTDVLPMVMSRRFNVLSIPVR